MKYDCVIVGGGLGGLTSGALLSQQGLKVLLLEQHYLVGGCATSFKRKGGFRCEVGLHELDGAYGPLLKNVFTQLEVYDNIELVPIHEFFRFKNKDTDFVFPHGVEATKMALIAQFPEEKSGIEGYFNRLEKIRNEWLKVKDLKWYFKWLYPLIAPNVVRFAFRTAEDLIKTYIKNEQLILILNGNVFYYNDSPQTLSAIYHAFAQYSYISEGAHFIKGGSIQLSNYLASCITRHGGEVIKQAMVTRIHESKGRVTGVSYVRRGKSYKVETDRVISNASPGLTYKQLLGYDYQERRIVADSLCSIYIGFSKNLKSVYGKRPYASFFHGEVTSIDQLPSYAYENTQKRPFCFTDYSQIDSGLSRPEKSCGNITTMDSIQHWEGLSEAEYLAKKDQLANDFIDRLEEDYPGIREFIEFYEVGTAKTVNRYTLSPNGSAYGFKPTPKQIAFRHPIVSQKVKGLFFTGAWVFGGGFSPSIYAGSLTANAVLK